MPLTKKGAKILRHMETEYGTKKGEQVFYASANKGSIAGVHHDADFAAETGEEPGKAINVSKGITPAMLNGRAQAMNAPETHDDDACDAEPGARAEMAARRVGQLREHGQKSTYPSHRPHVQAVEKGKPRMAATARSASAGRNAMTGPKARARATAKAGGLAMPGERHEESNPPLHKERNGPRK